MVKRYVLIKLILYNIYGSNEIGENKLYFGWKVVLLKNSGALCCLQVLYKFLEYYSTFDWNSYCVDINGLVIIPFLPEIVGNYSTYTC